MTATQIEILACTFYAGVATMNAIHAVSLFRVEKRADVERAAVAKKVAGDLFLSGFRLHRLTVETGVPQRPEEALRESLANFEQDLLDGLDRVEAAARKEGLL